MQLMQFEPEKFEMIKTNSLQEEPKIIIPFVGAFSSGKSSLINALLGEDILSTDIAPETVLPVELRAGGTQQFVACHSGH